MYHIELRKFPHSAWRFNQTEQAVLAVAVPWVREEWFEEGDRSWNCNEAKLTILEGPKLSMPDLAMGKGWRNAQRRSEDVTERVLAAVRAADASPQPGPQPEAATPVAAGIDDGEGRPAEAAAFAAREAPVDSQLLADSLGLELLGMLDAQPLTLSSAWSLAAVRLGDASAAESLALAELAVRSLAGRGLVVLSNAGDTQPDGSSPGAPVQVAQAIADDRVDAALRAVESWAGGEHGALQIARSS
jgi:hypothetical protein